MKKKFIPKRNYIFLFLSIHYEELLPLTGRICWIFLYSSGAEETFHWSYWLFRHNAMKRTASAVAHVNQLVQQFSFYNQVQGLQSSPPAACSFPPSHWHWCSCPHRWPALSTTEPQRTCNTPVQTLKDQSLLRKYSPVWKQPRAAPHRTSQASALNHLHLFTQDGLSALPTPGDCTHMPVMAYLSLFIKPLCLHRSCLFQLPLKRTFRPLTLIHIKFLVFINSICSLLHVK